MQEEKKKNLFELELEDGKKKYYEIPDDKLEAFQAKVPRAKRIDNKPLSPHSNTLDSNTEVEPTNVEDATNGLQVDKSNTYATMEDKPQSGKVFDPTLLGQIDTDVLPRRMQELTPPTREEIKDLSLKRMIGKPSFPELSRSVAESRSGNLLSSWYDNNFQKVFESWKEDKVKLSSELENTQEESKRAELLSAFENKYGVGSFTDKAGDVERTPEKARKMLENYKKDVEIPYSYAPFEGGPMIKGTKTEKQNTPLQEFEVKTFLSSTDLGKQAVQQEITYLSNLQKSIKQIKLDINNKYIAQTKLTQDINSRYKEELAQAEKDYTEEFRKTLSESDRKGIVHIPPLPKEIKKQIEDKYKEEYDKIDANTFADTKEVQKVLNELNKIEQAYNDRDKSAFVAGFKEFGRRFPWAMGNVVTFGLLDYAEMNSLKDAINNKDYEFTKKAHDLLLQYQQLRQHDRTISQEIAQGVTGTLPFMAEFALSGGIVSSAGKGIAKGIGRLATKYGFKPSVISQASNLINVNAVTKIANSKVGQTVGGVVSKTAEIPTTAAAKAILMPSTYRNALESQVIDADKSNFLDAFTHAWLVNTIANSAESIGDVLPNAKWGKKGSVLRKISDATSMQNFPVEFAEENIETALHAILETGEGNWSDLVDPRNQLVTAGTVLAIQAPYATIGSASYASAKYRNAKQKRNINKGYQANIVNMNQVFGEDATELRNAVDVIIFENNKDGFDKTADALNALNNFVVQNMDMTEDGINALYTYSMSAMAKHTMDMSTSSIAKEQGDTAKKHVLSAMNPDTESILSIKLTEDGQSKIVSRGKVVVKEDGTIDREQSSKNLYIKDIKNGTVEVISIDEVHSVVEEITKEEAEKEIDNEIEEQLRIDQDNDNSTVYDDGQMVMFDDGNGESYGTIIKVNPDGTYFVETNDGMTMISIPPSSIIDSPVYNLKKDDRVEYIDKDGNIQIANLETDIFPENMQNKFLILNGENVEFDNIIGKVEDNQQGFNEDGNSYDLESVDDEVETDNASNENNQDEQGNSIPNNPSEQNGIEKNRFDSLSDEVAMVDGKPDLTEAKPEVTAEFLNGYIGEKEAPRFVMNQILDIQKQLAGLTEPTASLDINDTKNRIDAYEKNKQVLEEDLEYWNEVKKQMKPVEYDAINPKDKLDLQNRQSENDKAMKPYKPLRYNSLMLSEEEFEKIAETSVDVQQLYDAYFTSIESLDVEVLEPWQQALLGLKINPQSFIDFGDVAFVSKTIASSWFASKSMLSGKGASVYGIDGIANALSYDTNIEVTPQMIIEFILDHPTNRIRKTSPLSIALQTRFVDVMNEVWGQNVGGPESQSAIQAMNIIKVAQEKALDNIPVGMTQKKLQVPSIIGLLEAEGLLNGISTFEELEKRIDELEDNGMFMFPYSPEDLQTVKNYIEYAKQAGSIEEAIAEYSESASDIKDVRNQIESENNQKEVKEKSDTKSKIEELETLLESGEISDFEAYQVENEIDRLKKTLDEETITPSTDEEINLRVDIEGQNINPNPTEAQKEAGNYSKGHVKIQGLDISIENAEGSTRSGIDVDGNAWSVTMEHPYGYIKQTEGADGDHVDVVIGKSPTSDKVFIYDQVDRDGNFDEHKVVIGANSIEEANTIIESNYNNGEFRYSSSSEVDMPTFKEWVYGEKTNKPYAKVTTESKTNEKVETNEKEVDDRTEANNQLNSIVENAKENKIKNEVIETVNTELTEIENEIKNAEKEYKAKINKIGKEEGKTQTEMFEEEKVNIPESEPDMFGMKADISNSNREAILKPLKDELDRLKAEKSKIEQSKDKRVNDAIESNRAQKELDLTPKEEVKEEATKKEVKEENNKPKNKPIVPKDFGKNNKVFTKDAFEDALKDIRDELNNLNMGLSPKMMQAAIKVTGYFIEGGVRSFIDYSHAMIEALGDNIVPYLKQFYMSTRYDPNLNQEWVKEMSSPAEVDAMTNEEILKSYKAKTEIVESQTEEPTVQKELTDAEKFALAQQKKTEKNIEQTQRFGKLFSTFLKGKLTDIDSEVVKQYNKAIANITEYTKNHNKEKLQIAIEQKEDVISRLYNSFIREQYKGENSTFVKEIIDRHHSEGRGAFVTMLNQEIENQLKSYQFEDKQLSPVELDNDKKQLVQSETEIFIEDIADKPFFNNLAEDIIQEGSSRTELKSEVAEYLFNSMLNDGVQLSEENRQSFNEIISKEIDKFIDKSLLEARVEQEQVNNNSFPLEIKAPLNSKTNEVMTIAAAKEAKKIAATFAKDVAEMLGYEHEVDKKGKPVYSSENIAPSGGDVTFRLFKPNSNYGVKVSFKYEVEPHTSNFDKLVLNGYNDISFTLIGRDGKVSNVVFSTQFESSTKYDLSANNIARQIKNLIDKNDGNSKGTTNQQAEPTSNKGTEATAKHERSNDSTSINGRKDADTSKSDNAGESKINKDSSNKPNPISNEVEGLRGEESESENGGDFGDLFSNASNGVQSRGRTDGRNNGRTNTNDTGAIKETTVGDTSKKTEKEKTEKKGKNSNNNTQSVTENVVPHGEMAKMEANIDAIKLMKDIVSNNRKATELEMQTLRQYTGWGGLINIFKNDHKLNSELKGILTEEEYNSAKQSTTTSFFTPPAVVSSIWNMIEKMGFKGGSILEPSSGIGNMFALMPEKISSNSELRAIEIDKISGNIMKLLYPDAQVDINGYQDTKDIKDNSMDVVVTNVPFGQMKIYDSQNKDISKLFNIQDFFFAKSVRKLKPGGIAVFVASTSTMDSNSTNIREWLNTNGVDFIGAVRLNDSTFKKNAGTTVTSDVIIVRKRDNGIYHSSKNSEFMNVANVREIEYADKDGNIQKASLDVNQYYLNNPNNMAGEMKLGAENGSLGFRPTSQTLVETESIDQNKVLEAFVESLPTDAFTAQQSVENNNVKLEEGSEVKEGSLTIIDNKPYIIQFGEAVPLLVDTKINGFGWNKSKAAGREKVDVLKDYLNLKNSLNDLIAKETNPDIDESTVDKARKELNKQYDNFVKRYGPLYDNRKVSFLKDDIDYAQIEAMENPQKNKDGAVIAVNKSDIFKKRVINHQATPVADNLRDAMQISFYKEGAIDIQLISNLLNKTPFEVEKEMLESGLAFRDPSTNGIVDKANYLSGNVREKLKIAEQENKNGNLDGNIKELVKVVPVDIPFSSISTKLGSTWIPMNVYDMFFKEVFNVTTSLKKTGRDTFITNVLNESNPHNYSLGVTDTNITGSKLALDLMNNKQTVVYDRTYGSSVKNVEKTAQAMLKQAELDIKFQSWIQSKKEFHESMAKSYNEQFNSVVEKKYDVESFDRFSGAGGMLVFMPSVENNGVETLQFRPALENTIEQNQQLADMAKKHGIVMNDGIYQTTDTKKAKSFSKEANGDVKILRHHQKEGVLRALDKAVLWAHQVGTGKTLTLITTAMEMKKKGLANKPLIVVQRSTIGQFVNEFKQQYPDAKILVPSAKDLKQSERDKLFSKIAYNEWDCVIMYHDYLDQIPDSPERVKQYMQELINEKLELISELQESKVKGTKAQINGLNKSIESLLSQIEEQDANVKKIAKATDTAEARAQTLLDRKTSNTMYFEQLGIDALLVDEAHGYKRLGFQTNLQNIKGIDTSASKKTQSMKLKSSYVLERNSGRNVVFATGTPISNTMAEMWTFIRYLLPKSELERLGMKNFDAFVNNFGNIEESAEFSTSGKFRMVQRFASYKNVPELLQIWKQISQTVLTEEVSTLKAGVGTPLIEGDQPKDFLMEQTPILRAVMAGIKNELKRYDQMSGKEKQMKENKAIPLTMFSYAARAAIDVRLVRSDLQDDPNSKLNTAVTSIIEDLNKSDGYKGTVAVFSDNLQSKDKKFVLFDEMKAKLIEQGIPEEQIAIISDYNTDSKKVELFAKINNGDIRVIMGSTEKLGVGVNIQERLFALHHLDAPSRPSDYQQRNGRIVRQGNSHLDMGIPIRIKRYGVIGTLDVTGYQRLAIKESFINQIMKGDVNTRNIEEVEVDGTAGNFKSMMANLSGSNAAVLLTQKENQLRKIESDYEQHKSSQAFYIDAIEKSNNVINTTSTVVAHLENYKKELRDIFGSETLTSIEVGTLKGHNAETIEKTLDSINKSIANRVEEVRKSGVFGITNMVMPIKLNGVDLKLEIQFDLTSQNRNGKNINVVNKSIVLTTDTKIADPLSRLSEYKEIPLIDYSIGVDMQDLPRLFNYFLSFEDVDAKINSRYTALEKAKATIDAYQPLMNESFDMAKYDKIKEEVRALEEMRDSEVKELETKDELEMEEIEAIDVATFGNLEFEEDEFNISETTDNDSTKRNYVEQSSKRLNKLLDKLRATGLATGVFIDSFIPKSILDNNPQVLGKENQVLGYVDKEGNVHLLADKLNLNTPIHEFGHLWLNMLKAKDYNAYVKGLNLILGSQEYMDRVSKNEAYANLSFEQRLVEALALAIGDRGEKAYQSKSFAFKNWISNLWTNIKELFGMKDIENIESVTLDSFLNNASKELLSNKEVTNRAVESTQEQFSTIDNMVEEVLGDDVPAQHRDNLDKKVRKMLWKIDLNKIRENYQDRYLPVKKLYEYLSSQGVEIKENQDFYKQATHVFGKIDTMLNKYEKDFHTPMIEAVMSITEEHGISYREIEDYLILKHGLERNEYFTRKNMAAGIELKDDYAGIIPIIEQYGKNAEEIIADFENTISNEQFDNLWESIHKATDNALNLAYKGGLIDKAMFTELSERYEHYIPLRGHDDLTAEDKWDYSKAGEGYSDPLKKAHGRTSRAASPLAYIFNINQSAISTSQKNLLNQTFLRLAEKDETGLMGVSTVWYEKMGENEEGKSIYEIKTPEYSTDTETRLQNEKDFQDKMLALESEGNAFRSRKHRINIDNMFIKPYQAKEHEVLIYRNGEPMVVYFNGNSAIPRAVNGTNVSQKADFLKPIAKITRHMAALFTTKNPKFVLTNAARDFIMASSALFIKEDFKYQLGFYKNLPTAMKTLVSASKKKHTETKYTKLLNEYLMNGASTGYSHFIEVGKLQRQIEKEIESGTKKKSMAKNILTFLGKANDIAESYTRFSVYLTSREQGRSIVQSVSDAKEVTLNFNRRGAGAQGNNFFTSSYVFFNVGVQALDNFARLVKNNPMKSATAVATYMLSGMLSPMLNSMMMGLIGGDDEDDYVEEYFKLGNWERQNNFCVWTGNGFLKIPIAQEFRVFYAMGDNVFQAMAGKKDWLDTTIDQITAFSDLVPMDPMGAVDASPAELFPDVVKPILQLAMNKKFTGGPIYNEWENKNAPGYKNVRTTRSEKPFVYEHMIDFSRMLNGLTGGDDVKRGDLSPNPDKVSYIMNGYFGGLYTMMSQSFDASYKLAKSIVDRDRDEIGIRVMDLPINSFYTSKDEMRLIGQTDLERYYNVKNAVERDFSYYKKYKMQMKEKNPNKDLLELSSKIANLEYNPSIIKPFMARIKAVDKISTKMKLFNGTSQKRAEEDLAALQMEVVDLYNNYDTIKDMNSSEIRKINRPGTKLGKYKAKGKK